MRKLLIAAAAFAALSTAALAEQNTENENRMFELRKAFFEMSSQMVEDEIRASEMHTKRLTAYQRLLKMMMENELSSHGPQ